MNGSAPWWLWMVAVVCTSVGATRFGLAVLAAAPTHFCTAGDSIGASDSAGGDGKPVVLDWRDARVDRAEILSGGPGVDGIPSLTTVEARQQRERVLSIPDGKHPPVVVPWEEGHVDLSDDVRVLGVVVNGEARAYPVPVLVRHECANDVLGGVPIAAIYCPLCDSFSVLDRRVGEGEDQRVVEFGISGFLHNSNVLLYDRTDFGLWSQLRMEAITGPRAGEPLRHLGEAGEWSVTVWADWKARHPDTTVMTTDTGMSRNYDATAYADFFASDEPMFPVTHEDDRLPSRTRVVGVLDTQDKATAYAFSALVEGRVIDTPEGALVLQTDGEHLTVGEVPEGYRVAQAFWYAWVAAHPETALVE